MKLTVTLLIFLFAVAAQASPNFLLGKWTNELGSVMTVDTVAEEAFSGIYRTAVSRNGTALECGSFNAAAENAGNVAFAVNWRYEDGEGESVISATTWCGVVRGDVAARALRRAR